MMLLYIFNPLTLLIVYIIYTKSSGLFKKLITIIGGLIDIAVNITWFSLIFIEFPKELLLTKRVERLKNSNGYRGYIANIICKLLNYFEVEHCV